MIFQRVGHKRHCIFLLALKLLALREASFHVVRILK